MTRHNASSGTQVKASCLKVCGGKKPGVIGGAGRGGGLLAGGVPRPRPNCCPLFDCLTSLSVFCETEWREGGNHF